MPVRLSRHDDLAVVQIDEPPLNVLTIDLLTEIEAVLDQAVGSRALLVESAIVGTFSAGADLKLAAQGSVVGFSDYLDVLNRVVDRVAGWPAPTIAVIEGQAFGGGLELAIACDLRVVGPQATVGLPESRLGLMPGAGGVHRLATWCPRPVVLDLLLTGRGLVGQEIVSGGLAQYLSADPSDTAHALARTLAAASPEAMQTIKLTIEQVERAPGTAARAERERLLELFGSPNGREGVQAFIERRAPVFR
jgi:enoyl-CoA hydratase/carnithine racemase